jgi:ribonucleotide reductase alpha subunit
MDPLDGKRFVVRKRDGRLDDFNEGRIHLAIESAFKAAAGVGRDAALPDAAQSAIGRVVEKVVALILSRAVKGEELDVEKIQDAVEEQLMLAGHVDVARRYILYREERRQSRAWRERRTEAAAPASSKQSLGVRLGLPETNFSLSINEGEFLRILAPEMLEFDLDTLAQALRPERDALFSEAGLQLLCDCYLMREGGRLIETPQVFWMRIAMGLAQNEGALAEARAVEFYEALSLFRFLPSAAILQHAGKAQAPSLASRVLTKFAGGVEEKETVGGTTVWLDAWHADITSFLRTAAEPEDFRKGIRLPDLFLQRVQELGRWTLFDPTETRDLAGLRGKAFAERFCHYEKRAENGQLAFARVIQAEELWQTLLGSVSAGGQTAVEFRDASPERNGPMALGSINVCALITDGALDLTLLRATVSTAVRMLDNALGENNSPSIGLGTHGFSEALAELGYAESSQDAAEFADRCAEALAHSAALASAELARERGIHAGFEISPWAQGIMPSDALAHREEARNISLVTDASTVMDWDAVRQVVKRFGRRHETLTAMTPDASIELHASAPVPRKAVKPENLMECAARRQKWMDGGQKFTLTVNRPATEDLHRLYFLAWKKGLDSVYPASLKAPNADERLATPLPSLVAVTI